MKFVVRHMRAINDPDLNTFVYMTRKQYRQAYPNAPMEDTQSSKAMGLAKRKARQQKQPKPTDTKSRVRIVQNAGYTEVLAYSDDNVLVARATAHCNPGDCFNKRLGTVIATNRLNRAIAGEKTAHAEVLKTSKVS